MTLKRYRNSELGERVVTRERLRLIIVSTGCARHPLYHGPSHLISAASHLCCPASVCQTPKYDIPGQLFWALSSEAPNSPPLGSSSCWSTSVRNESSSDHR